MNFYMGEDGNIKFDYPVIDKPMKLNQYVILNPNKFVVFDDETKLVIYRDRINFFYKDKLFARMKDNNLKILNKKTYKEVIRQINNKKLIV